MRVANAMSKKRILSVNATQTVNDLSWSHVRFVLKTWIFLLFFTLQFSTFAQMTVVEFISENVQSNDVLGSGCSFVDFNQDGWDDATFATPNGIFFFENDQNGQLVEVNLGINNTGDARHPIWIDLDNDGDLDFFTTNCSSPNRVWVNTGQNGFIEFSETSGLMQTNFWESQGVSWGDYNNDGFLDLYLTNYDEEITTNRLYRNNGNLSFTDVTASCNCSNGIQNSLQSLWFDYNSDGLLDIAVINDLSENPNTIFQNLGNGAFSDVGSALNFNQSVLASSLSMSDFNNDDDDDFYISTGLTGNLMLQFEDGLFEDIASNQGVTVNEICWGAQWFDLDNDADEDLFVATNNGVSNIPNAFFLNVDGNLDSMPENIGNDDSNTHSSSSGDINNDGFPDILLHTSDPNFKVLVNQPNDNNWLKVNLQGTVSNSFGVGSTLRVFADGNFQKRFVHCGEDYLGQDSFTELFGLAEAETIDSLEVTWPSGWVDSFYDVQVNQVLSVVEGSTFEPQIVITGTLCSNDISMLSVIGEEISTFAWNDQSENPTCPAPTSGIYSVIVSNQFNLVDTISIDVALTEAPNPQVNTTNVTCADGSDGMIELFNVSGIVVESVDWNNGAYAGEAIFGLEAGEYTFVMTDVNGCSNADTVFITQPAPVVPNLEFESPSCFGELGFAEVNPVGGSGNYTTIWSAEDPLFLSDGDYEVEVTDDSGCSANEAFSIIVPTQLTGTLTVQDANEGNNGFASVDMQGGTPPYTIQWSNADVGTEADQLGQGSYVVIVTDANGCSWSQSFNIIDTSIRELHKEVVLASFGNGQFELTLSSPAVAMQLIDATGKTVQTSTTTQQNFIFNLSSVPKGLYLAILQFEDGSEKRVKLLNY